MADTTAQRLVADWVNSVFLQEKFGMHFERAEVRLTTGGSHRFASASACRSIVGTICTSQIRTASGKLGVGKLTKIRADLYFLLLARAERRFVAFLDEGTFAHMETERRNGLVPESVSLVLVTGLPPFLHAKLVDAQQTASDEVSPD